jgi:SAM-dependent methyltransferase
MQQRPSRRILRTTLIVLLITCAGCTDVKRWAYEGFDRDEWQHPEEVIQALTIKPEEQIADLGSGSGYFTFRLADAVGPSGQVYAVDIDADMNAHLAKRLQEKGYKNIEVMLAKPHDPGLPENGVDLIFSTNTYHHLENRPSYFANARKYLRPNGRIAIIDFNGEGLLPTTQRPLHTQRRHPARITGSGIRARTGVDVSSEASVPHLRQRRAITEWSIQTWIDDPITDFPCVTEIFFFSLADIVNVSKIGLRLRVESTT